MADNDFAEFKSALIVGAGAGLSAALARVLTRAGLKVTWRPHHR
jgi:NADP-dependent 3-hydroxy acid dehydrogenase YdfG